ncbi:MULTISPECIES: ATP-binding protein [unclassified Spirosoma]|uniref:sensor histidine kinase n=1 Tax=unclassified Spirosoma TaxID=2621999 RepID=UPI000968C1D5|nr:MULTISPECIES: ATP-binding protein [unclassified Spirosoma]MBN8823477.1 hypothetical protein [Spirosoma sp.]OJW71913.1 MAG: hypothetical protein BGO59_16860 [Spirosoma sp. 48-14]
MSKLVHWKDNFWKGFGFDGLEPEEFKKRTSAVLLAIFTIGAGLCYSLIYSFLGFSSLAFVVYTYVPVCLLNILYLRFSHQYQVFGGIQLVLIFIFPLAAQLAIGSYVDASAVVLSTFLAPAGALIYASRRIARLSFYLFMVAIVGVTCWEYFFGRPEMVLPRGIVLIFFSFNLIIVCAIIFFLLESFLQKQDELRAELRQSLHTLKITQNQLIQSEKLASLGELTAGIAHEIQNPLNFVNNFSEVSTELIEELKEEAQAGRIDDVLALANDLDQNLKKVIFHGKRAGSIVRGMLEHSRSGTGERQLTQLNDLADEYLRLAYQGQRANDKTFNCTLQTDFASGLPQLNLVPQDIGRVLLNLFQNALYAVRQRQKQEPVGYTPTVWISTSQQQGQVVVSVKDNGTGMSEVVRGKIFQPFFTTKPTGEGTGLGLSLSYDIVTKGHNGTLDVESRAGEGSKFVMKLPLVYNGPSSAKPKTT